MINPDDVSVTPARNGNSLEACERQFDDAIRAAERTGQWPAKVAKARDDMPRDVVESTAQKYRDAGWEVSTSDRRHRAVIDHPNRK